ncbi:MAG: hypothetical protein AB7L09_02630 [Nitrospira sp.]
MSTTNDSTSAAAKSLLQAIRDRKQGNTGFVQCGSSYGPFGNPMTQIRLGGGGALDEMLELYIAARESDDVTRLQKQLDELTAKYKSVCESNHKHFTDLQTAIRDRSAVETSLNASQSLLRHLLREGDIIVTCHFSCYGNSEKARRKLLNINRETGDLTYVNWDRRAKDWGRTEHSESLEKFVLNRQIVQVERPDDKERPTEG